jgi:hypothetical protein
LLVGLGSDIVSSVTTLAAFGMAPGLVRQVRALGCEVQIADTPDAAVQTLADGCDGLLLQIHGADAERLAPIDPAMARRVTLLMADPTEAALLALTRLPPVGALIAKPGAISDEEVLVAVGKRLRGDLFGLEKYLAAGTPVSRCTLTQSGERGEAVDALDAYLADLALDPRLVGQLMTAADEFITNAFYNAPIDGKGRHVAAHLSRLESLPCPPGHTVELSYGSDGRRVGVAVHDSFGSFDPPTLLKHLAKAHGEGQPTFGTSGAGLGLSTALRAVSQMVFNLQPTRATECIGLIEVAAYREFAARGKSIHVFYNPDGQGHEHTTASLVA